MKSFVIALLIALNLAGCVTTGIPPVGDLFKDSKLLAQQYASQPNPFKTIPVSEPLLAKRSPGIKSVLDELAKLLGQQKANLLVAVQARSSEDALYLSKTLDERIDAHSTAVNIRVITFALADRKPEIRIYREGQEYPAGKIH